MSRRLGLIIGVNNYQDTTFQPLQYAENDARALAQWLVNIKGGAWSPGDVQLVQGVHATKELVESLLAQMCLTLAEPDDLVLLYFAGHAFLDERGGDGFLALSNTQYGNPTTGLHLLSFAHQVMNRCRAAHILVILDCFQTGSAWQMRRSSLYDVRPLIGSTLLNMLQRQGNRIFLCSCRGNAGAPEVGERSLGLFMHRSIIGLSGAARDASTGQVRMQNLYAYLSNILGEQQSPKLFGEERIPLILVGDVPSTSPLQGQSSPPAPFNNSATSGLQRNTGDLFRQPATATMPAPSSFPTNPMTTQQLSPSPDVQGQSQFLLNQAQQLVQVQQYMQALNLIEQALRITPQEVSALILKGQILGTMGRFQEALTAVDQLMQVNNRNPLAWSMRAVVLTNLGQYQNALESIDHSLALDGNNPETQTIKKNIMNTITMAAAQGKNRALQDKSSAEQARKNSQRMLVVSIIMQIVGLGLGVAGIVVAAFFNHLPTVVGAFLMGLGMLLLCISAARSTYRYGWRHLMPPFLTSVIAIGIIVFGGLLNLIVSSHTPANAQLLKLLKGHPSLIIPILVLGIWLAAVAVVPPILAMGGLIGGLTRGKRA
ncbi:MAG: caspase family protein [Ktedonobacteraceae bacterium]|nr:caspase family protein [Ktedonobacteraceae bacterium]MBV9614189.1 caspase family protein [Ktedonobacteraceae bacterium]